MRIELPILEQKFVDGKIIPTEKIADFEVDTSIYSEERWEQNFPILAEKEGLFQYIARIQDNSITERVRVSSMLKAIYCFIESDEIPTYKHFAKMINLSTPEYTTRILESLKNAFKAILNGSSTKN